MRREGTWSGCYGRNNSSGREGTSNWAVQACYAAPMAMFLAYGAGPMATVSHERDCSKIMQQWWQKKMILFGENGDQNGGSKIDFFFFGFDLDTNVNGTSNSREATVVMWQR
ncbi:hypothetical protein ACOSQ3_022486 [Xanthoceras sorbifolium]